MSLNVVDSFWLGSQGNGKAAQLVTRDKKHLLPLSMKVKGQIFPQYSIRPGKSSWVDSLRNRTDITPETCPLFTEIQKYLYRP